MRRMPNTDLDVFPLCLGGNVFGWTVDRDAAFGVLDAYAAIGGNFIDTADAYAIWVDGVGGQSERIIGDWHTSRGNRDDIVIATKVGQKPGRTGLAGDNVRLAADDSLKRLQTDRIDVYFAHIDDAETPLEESLGAMAALVDAGKVRYIAASNYSAARLEQALEISDREGLPRYVALEPEYNLLHRVYEDELQAIAAREQLGCMPYFGLAKGFLTGKYRPDTSSGDSPRAAQAMEMLDERGVEVLAALDDVAGVHGVPVAAVALGWLLSKPTVVAALASARTPEQLRENALAVSLELTTDQIDRLDRASSGT